MSRVRAGLVWVAIIGLALSAILDLGQAKPYVFAVAFLLICSLVLLHVNGIIGRRVSGEVVLRQTRGAVPWWVILVTTLNTLLYFAKPNKDPYLLAMWWSALGAFVLMAVRLKRAKPIMFALHGDELLINGRDLKSRDLRTLTRIEFNGLFCFYRLRFSNARPITIEQYKFKEEEADAFLEHVLRSAGPNVTLSDNLGGLCKAREPLTS